ncbi:MAG: tRNA (N(6)-L-threonylcarbamoyladenosine(37)-C(2))-methylthiotransferase MtaB [Bacilli bacterium]|jgi:threonylcarbamoyladenosine tRNA methylthiotransferase MtaB|nr:tRNA (N(6)-L-threonylcarbamoyladenosine(37)-C(2))-methylthiotransferase MtaB [Bacilli bacterium]
MNFTIFTLGCKVNTYESDAVRELFLSEGWLEAKENENVDLVVINTCTVTGTAAKKSRQHIRKFRHAYPRALVVVMGCYSQEQGGNIIDECGADLIIGTSHRGEILNLIKEARKQVKRRVIVEADPRAFDYEEIATLFQPLTSRAFVKIQDGCDNFCSYCIIPYVRGKSRSRRPEEIKKEIQTLVNNGYQEIVITGIHTGGYGKDLNNYSFSRLIREILEETPDLYRLRISSIEATEIDDEFVNLLTKYINIANHLHIPLQSGSETVLKRMNRRYKICDYIKTIEKIRNACPDIALTTDVIVGFPGETEQEFQETVTLIEQLSFSELHVFPFSNRENTAAAKMTKQIDNSLKKERVSVLLDVSKKLHNAYESKYFGKELDVLFEDFDKINGTYRGHTSNYLEVHVKSQFDLEGKVCVVAYYGPQNSLVKKG